MKRRQKAALLLVTLGLTAGIAACGSDDEGGSTSASTSASTSTSEAAAADWLTAAQDSSQEAQVVPTEIAAAELGAFSPKPDGSIFHVACNLALEGCSDKAKSLEAGVKALGYDYEQCNGGTSPVQIGQCFTNAINAKPDVIVVNGIGTDIAKDSYTAAEKAGIPIVAMFSGNPPGEPGVVAEVGGDSCAQGSANNADWVIADSEGKANVLWVGTETFACNQQRKAAFMEGMEACEDCETSDLTFAIDGLTTTLPQQLQAELQSKPDLTYIVGTFDAVALTAADAVRQAGKTDKIKVAGHDANAPNLELIRKGDIQLADATTGAIEPGWAAADAAARIIAGEEVPEIVPVTTVLVTPENIEQIGDRYDGPEGFEDQFLELWQKG